MIQASNVLRITSYKFNVIVWGMIYWLVLVISYTWSLQRHFGLDFQLSFDIFKFVIAFLSIIIVLFIVPINNSIYSLYLVLIYYLIIAPLGCVYCSYNGSSVYYFTVIILFGLSSVAIERLSFKHVKISLESKENTISKSIIILSIIIVILTVLLLFYYMGFPNLDALDFASVYEIRESYNLNSTVSQLVKISSQVSIPFLITIAYFKQNYRYIVLLLFVQFLLFLWLAHKSILFSIVVIVLGVYISNKSNRVLVTSKLLTIIVSIISLLEGLSGDLSHKFYYNVYQIYGLVVRRAIFVPAMLRQYYYSYFVVENHDLAGLFGTIISPILTRLQIYNPYEKISYTKTIGNVYWNGANANTGIFGGELAHFSYAGLFVAAICLIIIMLCIKTSETTSGKAFACSVSIYTITSLTNAKGLDLICFSPLMLLCIVLLVFNLNFDSKDLKFNSLSETLLEK